MREPQEDSEYFYADEVDEVKRERIPLNLDREDDLRKLGHERDLHDGFEPLQPECVRFYLRQKKNTPDETFSLAGDPAPEAIKYEQWKRECTDYDMQQQYAYKAVSVSLKRMKIAELFGWDICY